ncbi:DUF2155 domain-containing protein [Pseudoroseicyclus aestuarii]|uniref:DUF2155 domain-containing protein n=1 Tax=Pseudoroseicyclus aestuarii TaxID=1795041 RepID=A0A318SXF6_9RHOB|nr:DUF2155 domain-containing protein [Pseudoroseicyclus aestuarii]PYE86025.1 hypothetical protein DFP88_101700 [Pseudoroseicyclus aestuarii]
MRGLVRAALAAALLLPIGSALPAQESVQTLPAERASGGSLRILDKITGIVRDYDMTAGETVTQGLLTVTLGECRYPTANPAGDAFELLTIRYGEAPQPVFRGWMIATAPALNPLDHPRYDVWPLRCRTS